LTPSDDPSPTPASGRWSAANSQVPAILGGNFSHTGNRSDYAQ
jgi:hypothetical protein